MQAIVRLRRTRLSKRMRSLDHVICWFRVRVTYQANPVRPSPTLISRVTSALGFAGIKARPHHRHHLHHLKTYHTFHWSPHAFPVLSAACSHPNSHPRYHLTSSLITSHLVRRFTSAKVGFCVRGRASHMQWPLCLAESAPMRKVSNIHRSYF